MATPLPTDEQIDAYLLDRLDEQAEAALEARMAAEPAVKEAVLLRKMERAAVEQLVAKDLRARMEGWQAERDASTPPDTRLRPLWIGGLIAAAAAVALLLWLIVPGSPESEFPETELLALYDHSLLQHAKGGAEQGGLPTQLNEVIQREDWSQAIDLLSSVPASDSVYHPWAQEWLPHALMEAGEYEAAAGQFAGRLATEPENLRIRQENEWHLLLSWRLAGPAFQSQADSLSAIVRQAGHAYQRKAEALSKIGS